MRTHCPESRRRQSGLSLVELMVAMTIGLFLMAGITASFVNVKLTFVSQHALAELQDNERLALAILTNAVQAAGYFPDPLSTTSTGALPARKDSSYGNFADGQGLVGTPATLTVGQTLTSRYVAGNGDALGDCLGRRNTTGSPALIVNTFSV